MSKHKDAPLATKDGNWRIEADGRAWFGNLRLPADMAEGEAP